MKVPEKPWNGIYGSLFRYTFPMNALEEIAAQSGQAQAENRAAGRGGLGGGGSDQSSAE